MVDRMVGFEDKDLTVLDNIMRDIDKRIETIEDTDYVPSGVICMWSGSVATIPSGWCLCDGNNSTPDLRDKFIVGAKEDDGDTAKTNITGALTQTGGAATHTHTIPYPHNDIDTSGAGARCEGADTGSASSLPTYYALAFIMKS